MTVTLPQEKKAKLLDSVTNKLRKSRATIRPVVQVVGSLIAARQATKHGLLFTKEMENKKITALKTNRGDFDKKMDVTLEMKQEFQWWLESLDGIRAPILLPLLML
jgi:hypothetical protein